VDEPVVHQRVAEAEQRHSDPGSERDLAPESRSRTAPVEHERDGDGRVEERQGVVLLEATEPRLVMTLVQGHERPVPDEPVQERGPHVHERGDHERRRTPDERRAHVCTTFVEVWFMVVSDIILCPS
jgi:hypothetical protein